MLALTLSFTVPGHAQDGIEAQRGLGARYDKKTYLVVPGPPPLARGDFTDTPSQVSLKAFAPSPGDQGPQGSCVGWATAYAARTLITVKQNGISSRSEIRPKIHSPSFIYNQLTNGDCERGTYISEALDMITTDGVPLMSEFPYEKGSCTRLPSSAQRAQASEFRIKGYNRLWGSGHNKHIAVRRALAAGHPVVIGMGISSTFIRLGPGEGLYKPSSDDLFALKNLDAAYDSGYLGGHAMTVVSYDDNKYGGAFELINSWGAEFGDNGYVWVTYSDFNGFVNDGYEMVPLDPPPPPKVVDMAAQLEFIELGGATISTKWQDGYYVLDRPMPSGSRFRATVKTQWPAHVYLIGGDNSGDYVELFPRDGKVEPHIYNGATLLLPGPTESYFSRLNDTVGTDYYIVLVSQKPLDIGAIAREIKSETGRPKARLRQVFADRLVAWDDIEFSQTSTTFEATSGEASVVPFIIKIDHIAPDKTSPDTQSPQIVLKSPALEAFDAAVDQDTPIIVSRRFVKLSGTAQDLSAIASLVVEGALSAQFSSRGPFRAELELPNSPGPHDVAIVAQDAAGNTARRVFRFTIRE